MSVSTVRPEAVLANHLSGNPITPELSVGSGVWCGTLRRSIAITCAQFDDREVVYSENGAFATTSAKLGDVYLSLPKTRFIQFADLEKSCIAKNLAAGRTGT